MFTFLGVALFWGPGPMELLVILLMTIFMIVTTIIPYWLIFSKAGFNGALSLLMLLPFVNVVMLFFLAFMEWPALKNRQEDNFYR